MTKINRNLPVYYRIVGDTKACASFIGIDARMRKLQIEECSVESVQKVGGEIVVVKTKASSGFYSLNPVIGFRR